MSQVYTPVMDEYGKHRDGVGRFKPGHPGRKPNGIAAALRRMTDPDEIAEYLLGVVRNEKVSHKDRLAAAGMIMDRIDGRAVSTIAVAASVTAAPRVPDNWDAMLPAERDAWLKAFRANALAGGTLALHAATSGEDDDE